MNAIYKAVIKIWKETAFQTGVAGEAGVLLFCLHISKYEKSFQAVPPESLCEEDFTFL